MDRVISHSVSGFLAAKNTPVSLVPKCVLRKMMMFFPDCGSSEEDGGFGIYGDKTRYATLQKKREVANNVNVRGYETMRNLRTSIPSLVSSKRISSCKQNRFFLFKAQFYHLHNFLQSQEVTYAELSLPRNKGYAPMRTSPSDCNNATPVLASIEASANNVIYARIDHAAKRGNNNLSMLNQAQTTVPLLISNSSGGGVSPSSIMNTSCESSASSGSASRYISHFNHP